MNIRAIFSDLAQVMIPGFGRLGECQERQPPEGTKPVCALEFIVSLFDINICYFSFFYGLGLPLRIRRCAKSIFCTAKKGRNYRNLFSALCVNAGNLLDSLNTR